MPSERRLRCGLLSALLMLALGDGACSNPRSFIVLKLRAATPTSIVGVKEVVVAVVQGTAHMKTLTYPSKTGATFTIDQAGTTDLSVSFTGDQSGTVTLMVDARDGAGCIVGTGQTTAVIRKGSVAGASVELAAVDDCSNADGGAGTDGGLFPGCDPVSPMCAANQTCQVNCEKKAGQCTPGGTGKAGTVCRSNLDCSPGTQCFDYSTTGCNVKLCLRFCNDNNGCTPGGSSTPDGGAGTGDAGASPDGGSDAAGAEAGSAASKPPSLCLGPVQCGTAVTGYRTCTFSCDPRQAAAAGGSSGCPTGLSCLVVGSMDQVDCACPEATRKKTAGQPCAGASECAPGFICNQMGNTQTCRAVCRCDATGMGCTAPNDCTIAGTACTALTNDTMFGVCL